MEYKDFIKPGMKVLHLPERQDSSLYYYDPCVVTIGNYRPYYRDGSPDPKPEEYCEWNCVEIEDETEYGETQLFLDSLLPIIQEKKAVIYDGKIVNTFGYDEDKEYCILEDFSVVYSDDVDEVRTIYDLSYEELEKLREQICLGSMYLSDYRNDLGIDQEEACAYAEEYDEYLYAEYGDNWEEHDTPKEFADYFANL